MLWVFYLLFTFYQLRKLQERQSKVFGPDFKISHAFPHMKNFKYNENAPEKKRCRSFSQDNQLVISGVSIAFTCIKKSCTQIGSACHQGGPHNNSSVDRWWYYDGLVGSEKKVCRSPRVQCDATIPMEGITGALIKLNGGSTFGWQKVPKHDIHCSTAGGLSQIRARDCQERERILAFSYFCWTLGVFAFVCILEDLDGDLDARQCSWIRMGSDINMDDTHSDFASCPVTMPNARVYVCITTTINGKSWSVLYLLVQMLQDVVISVSEKGYWMVDIDLHVWNISAISSHLISSRKPRHLFWNFLLHCPSCL